MKITAERFWWIWLKISLCMVMFAGIFLVLISTFSLATCLDTWIDDMFFKGFFPGYEVVTLKRWLTGLAGAVTAGWGYSMLFVVNNSFRKGEKWAWKCIFYPLLLWFICDSFISACYSVYFNVLIKTILFLQVAAPLLFLRNQLTRNFNQENEIQDSALY